MLQKYFKMFSGGLPVVFPLTLPGLLTMLLHQTTIEQSAQEALRAREEIRAA